jgi:hypothetical protein
MRFVFTGLDSITRVHAGRSFLKSNVILADGVHVRGLDELTCIYAPCVDG